eukprot:TRINITY_DN65869_c0_g1_i1.p1 TRINITY_DN65869_c0_g1~~TRINITY_DN65869_c0_g1_i1.p1  ORF type:complete len:570 (-),score=199.52 TRINITY_DN65869_c0_g1_i1:152-1861(-)
MPIDPGRLRKVVDDNDIVADKVKSMTEKLKKIDAKNFKQTSDAAKEWSDNVRRLKKSLKEQSQLSKDMRETARIQDEQHSDVIRDRYRFVIDRLKSDIRYYFHALQDFVDMPQDFANQKQWDHCAYDMERDIKSVNAPATEAGCNNLEPIITLMNYRDAVIAMMLNGLLFQLAVLHWDMESKKHYADGPMVAMAERVVNIVSKTDTVHHKLEETPPGVFDTGPFTFDQNKAQEKQPTATAELTPLQARLITLLREAQNLDSGLRNMKFGKEVTIPDEKDPQLNKGKIVSADSLRIEVTKWHKKCLQLEHELQQSKAQRHAPLEQQLEQLTAKLEEKEKQHRVQVTKMHKLEGDLQSKGYENFNLKRERNELQEKVTRMSKENVPVLDKIDKLLAKSNEAVDRLNADAELLSSMFQIQVNENKNNVSQRDEISQELSRVQRQLKSEKTRSEFKQEELQKKETLYLRTMAARKSIHESYLEQKQRITEVEEKMRKHEVDRQELLRVVEGKDSEIKELQNDLRRASQRIDELEQQKKAILEEYKNATGKSCNALLQGFKAQSVLPPPSPTPS